MDLTAINISDIKINDGRRTVDTKKVESLKQSIEEVGLINPITLSRQDNNYILVAGMHRLEAFKLMGKESIKANVIEGSDLELELIEIDENLIRNELHYTEADDLTLRRKQIYEEMHPETKPVIGKELASKRWNASPASGLASKPTFVEDTAVKTGKSRSAVYEDLKRAEKIIPEAKPILKEKEITKTEANELAKKEPEVQKKIVESLTQGTNTIKEAEKQIRNQERKELIEQQIEDIETGKVELPEGTFEVLVVDPPWNYGTRYDAGGRRVANPYPEMTQEELLEMEIPASDDSVMFLWTTHRFIFDAEELLKQWGFTYRNIIVWNKEKIGMGDLFRMQCEFCLVGLKGKPLLNNNHTWRDIITEPRREHSRKPEFFYEMVNELCPGRKLDYFSREQREGWATFGNDTNKF